jgi:threonine aldolase
MMDAEVGDDILDGDPTTKRLEERVAGLLGMEAALFFPSGTQANQTGIWVNTDRGTEVVLEANAHIVHYELAAAAALAGVQIRPVVTPDGILTPDLAAAAVRRAGMHHPRTSAMAAENTHNVAGGKVMPLAVWDGLVDLARESHISLHLDGARLWNAAVALGTEPDRVARGATTVSVCLSKGLGCPVGSCLAGGQSIIDEARDVRRRFGGSMRQSGFLAAAGLYALDHNLGRIADDHANARLLAERLDGHPAVRPLVPESNIIMLDLVDPQLTAERAIALLAEAGVLVVPFSATRLRVVTHLDVSTADVRNAADTIAAVLQSYGG